MNTLIENNFQSLFQDITDFIFILDMNGNILEINKAVIRHLGYTSAELIGRSVLEVHPHNFREKAQLIIKQMLSGEIDTCPIPLITKSKIIIPVETSVYKGTWHNKKVLIGVSRNLSELSISDGKFGRLFDLSNIMMSISTYEQGIYVNVNKQLLNNLGYTEEEMIGRSSYELSIFADFEDRKKIQKALETEGKCKNIETRIRTKNGEIIHCLFFLDVITFGKKKYLLSSGTDISEQKKAEEQLKCYLKQQKLVADISQKFIHSKQLSECISTVLSLLGEHTHVSRIHLLKLEPTNNTISCLYDWCATGYESQQGILQNISLNSMHSLLQLIEKEGRVKVNDIEELPEDMKNKFRLQGIYSILIYPIYIENRIWGTIGFDECENPRSWENSDLELLRTISNIISNAIEREVAMTLLKENERLLNHKMKQQLLVSDISQVLISTTNFRSGMNTILHRLGTHTGVSRVYIFEMSSDECYSCNTFEWCNQGIEAQKNRLQNVDLNEFPSWMKLLKSENRILANHIEDLPEDLRAILEGQNIKSILVYPIHIDKKFYGYIGFDECICNKTWLEDETELLHTVANIISNAFERENSSRQMKESEMRLKLAIKGANEGLWDWDIVNQTTFYNDNWYQMLGYKPTDIISDYATWESLIHPEDAPLVKEKLKHHISRETSNYEAIYRMKTKQGTWKWILGRGNVVARNKNGNATRMIGTHIDITQQKEAELMLKELIATRDKLFSIIAHDLRGPIGTLLQVLQLLTNDHEIDEQTEKEFLKDLKTMSENTFQLLENLLSWSKSQRNEINFQPVCFPIAPMMKDSIRIHQSLAKQKEIEIVCEACHEPIVYADPNMVNLVIRNLLSNALKFTPRGGTIKITGKLSDCTLQISITDNGVGIPETVIQKIFKRKEFMTTRGTENETGSGLGLLLCQDFVERNGGDIWVESTPGDGSTFYFTVPITTFTSSC